MKLVQKTILASAIAVALTPAAFADVTLKGKVAAEIVNYQNSGGEKGNRGASMLSDGLEIDVKGEYDIIGGNTAGFGIDLDLFKNTWGNASDEDSAKSTAAKACLAAIQDVRGGSPTPAQIAAYNQACQAFGSGLSAQTLAATSAAATAGDVDNVALDQAHLFVKTGFGKFSFGKLDLPTSGIEDDYWSNSAEAGEAYFLEATEETTAKTITYTVGNDTFDYGLGVAAIRATNRAGGAEGLVDNDKRVTRENQFLVDTAVAFNAGPAKLEAGFQHDPVKGQGNTILLGTDVDLGATGLTATLSHNTTAEDQTSALLGAKHKFTDVVTGKATFSTARYKGKKTGEGKSPMQFAAGADFALAKNIVAHAVLDVQDMDIKESRKQFALSTGMTLKF